MKKIWTTISIVFTIICIIFLGYEFIADTDYVINFIIYDWRWKIGFGLAYAIHCAKKNKKSTN